MKSGQSAGPVTRLIMLIESAARDIACEGFGTAVGARRIFLS